MRIAEPRWIVRSLPPEGSAEVSALARRLGTPPSVARLLWLRGHGDEARARTFLRPRLADLEPPRALPDVDVAAERVARAVRQGERVAVCGDYDVDGMTGTALLVRFLRLAGADVTWSIPDRLGDGYGLSVGGVERLAAQGVRLAVTVDNGVSAFDAIVRARELGIDVVVTDHHLPPDVLPPAVAIVNPHRTDVGGASPSAAALCGCALAFKVAWAVADRLRGVVTGGETAAERADRFKAFLRDAVGLVALATVSDVMPLVGENRVLVAAGLQALAGSEHAGLRALLAAARVGSGPLTTEDVAWRIAPRLNAAGRLSRPGIVVDLLTATDAATADELAQSLERANEERRDLEKGVLAEATARASELLARSKDGRSVVVHGDGWHRGVIGIVAARLVDLHQRPVAVIGLDGDVGRGSCRTRAGRGGDGDVDLHRALKSCGGHLARFGGHAAAAGFDIRRERLAEFADAFEEAVRQQEGLARPEPTLVLDGETTADEWTLDAVEALQRLAPFGAGNPEPRFVLSGVRAAGRPRLLGETQGHLSFALPQTRPGASYGPRKPDGPTGAIRVVAFRRPDLFDLVASGVPLDLAVTPVVNEWRGTRSAELRLVAARETAPQGPA